MSQQNLVPLDGSPLAELALSEALTLAQLADSKVNERHIRLHPTPR
jgi:nucleotide-binding universal stress UspA family protein